jgi:hypothetical protein
MTSTSDQILELYKLSVEMADRISSRRGLANAFFVSVNTALVAAFGLASSAMSNISHFAWLAFSGVGTLLSVVWWLQLRSYRDLNKAKFAVILDLEKQLPAQPFAAEDSLLPKDQVKFWRGKYAELGTSERVVPWLFICFYLILIGLSAFQQTCI